MSKLPPWPSVRPPRPVMVNPPGSWYTGLSMSLRTASFIARRSADCAGPVTGARTIMTGTTTAANAPHATGAIQRHAGCAARHRAQRANVASVWGAGVQSGMFVKLDARDNHVNYHDGCVCAGWPLPWLNEQRPTIPDPAARLGSTGARTGRADRRSARATTSAARFRPCIARPLRAVVGCQRARYRRQSQELI